MTSCAAYKTYNQTTGGRVFLRGGVFENDSWGDALTLKRASWYHGMTLYFDALFWEADLDSPFSKWFSSTEKEFFTKCSRFVVTASYSADPSKISHVNLREQMKLNGYDDVVINQFASYLKSHPSAPDWRLQNYKVLGFCKRSPSTYSGSALKLNFPSFSELKVGI